MIEETSFLSSSVNVPQMTITTPDNTQSVRLASPPTKNVTEETISDILQEEQRTVGFLLKDEIVDERQEERVGEDSMVTIEQVEHDQTITEVPDMFDDQLSIPKPGNESKSVLTEEEALSSIEHAITNTDESPGKDSVELGNEIVLAQHQQVQISLDDNHFSVSHEQQTDRNSLTLNKESQTEPNRFKRDQSSLTDPIQNSTTTNELPQSAANAGSYQSMIENALIDLKTELQSLSNDISLLRKEFNAANKSTETQCSLNKHTKQVKKLEDLWETNLVNTSAIKNAIEANFQDIEHQKVQQDELQENIRKLKMDLKNYYNSAFFREDSKLLKEMHKVITQDPKSVTTSTGISGAVHTPESDFPSLPSLHPSRNQQVTPSVPQESTNSSRRGIGFTMTDSGAKIPMPKIKPTATTTRLNAPTRKVPSKQAVHPTAPPLSSLSSTANKFKTVLITDSILRHIDKPEMLGVNHEVHLINKRDSYGLRHEDLRDIIRKVRPEYVFIHLGINDIFQKIDLRDTLSNFIKFKSFIDWQFGTKLMISLPLFTRDREANHRVCELRAGLKEFADRSVEFYPPLPEKFDFKKIWINSNSNFMKDGILVGEFYGYDGVHLSDKGKEIILGNFRHLVHHVNRVDRNKPRKMKQNATRRSLSGHTT